MNPTKRISVYYKAVVGPGMPGQCAYAFSVSENEEAIYHECEFRGELGNLTSIQAQYVALMRTLDWMLDKQNYWRMHVRMYGDNQFVTNQVNGILLTPMDGTATTNMKVRETAKQFNDIAFTWVSAGLLEPLAGAAEAKLREKGILVDRNKKAVRAR